MGHRKRTKEMVIQAKIVRPETSTSAGVRTGLRKRYLQKLTSSRQQPTTLQERSRDPKRTSRFLAR
jgi:hypothetical protein